MEEHPFFSEVLLSFPYLKHFILLFLIFLSVFVVTHFLLFVANLVLKIKKNKNNGSGDSSLSGVLKKIRKWLNQGILIWIAISVLGFTIGLMAGNSRTAIVDTVITTVVTVYGGFSIYWFSRSDKNRFISASVMIVFSISVLYGVHQGAQYRRVSSLEKRHYEEQRMIFESKIRINEYMEKKRLDRGE